MPSEWLNSVLERLSSFRHLRYSWDGHQAAPISVFCITHARILLKRLDDYGVTKQPVVMPEPSGRVSMFWDFGDWSINLTVQPKGEFTWIGLRKDAPDLFIDEATRYPSEVAAVLGENPGNLA